MKRNFKGVLSLLLAAVMIFGSVAVGLTDIELPDLGKLFAQKAEAAETSGTCGENLTWTFDQSTGTLTISGTGEMYDWSDSGNMAPWRVGAIRTIRNIVISEGVTSIGKYAFYSMMWLSSVTLPSTVKRIAKLSFARCDSLKEIILPDSVESIGEMAFYYCSSLEAITIPDSVDIGDSAFSYTAYYNNASNWENDALYIGKYLIKAKTSISGEYAIKNGTVYIAGYAFQYCSNLTKIEIPGSVKSVGEAAFAFCGSLAEIVIPDSVKTIGEFAFEACESLTSVTVPESVDIISGWMFRDCVNLESVTLGSSVKEIGVCAFFKCTKLASINIPDGVKSIGEQAFNYCESLNIIKLPDSVVNIGSLAFNYTGYYRNDGNWRIGENGKELYINNHLIKLYASPKGDGGIFSYEVYSGTVSI
ncbi:MAG: leucine-rich repeat domain-containing protein, partial [Clostridia bacterium]|nr:leucine-rich repeat domain-containing protein [Clostridia bacterium]